MKTLKYTGICLAIVASSGAVQAQSAERSEELLSEMLRQQTLSHQADIDERKRKIELKKADADLEEENARVVRAQTEARLAVLEAEIAQREADQALAPKADTITRDEAIELIRAEALSLRASIESMSADNARAMQRPMGGFAEAVEDTGPRVRWLGLVGRDIGMFEFNGSNVVSLRVGQTEEGVTLTALDAEQAITSHSGKPTTHRLNR